MPAVLETNSWGHLEFTEEFTQSYELLENSQTNIFISGQAGTGKSTLLKYFRQKTKKNLAVLAPTGVAALNVQGQTIHSFFQFKPDITMDAIALIRLRKDRRKMYGSLETLIIDEISMVRADLLDCIDAFLRLHGPKKDQPFGGIQMVFLGDLYQLPPVVTSFERGIFQNGDDSEGSVRYASPFFFDAKSFKTLKLKCIELKKIYRQKEQEFIDLLGKVREKLISVEELKIINSRYFPNFEIPANEFYIYLTTTNEMADRINHEELQKLKTRPYHFEGSIDGDFELKNLPTSLSMDLRFGAQVMLLNNDSQGRWVNGSIGKIVGVNSGDDVSDEVIVELSKKERVFVAPFTWQMYRFSYNEDTERIESEEVGSFTQYPLRLAWAITIHKSQGKTFSKVILDIGTGTFSHGQLYVALSRCTDMDGLILKKPILRNHIILDSRIKNFFEAHHEQ